MDKHLWSVYRNLQGDVWTHFLASASCSVFQCSPSPLIPTSVSVSHLMHWDLWSVHCLPTYPPRNYHQLCTKCWSICSAWLTVTWEFNRFIFFKWLAHNLNPLPSVHPVLLLTPCWSQALDLPTLLRCDIVNEGLLSPLVVFLFIFLLWGLTLGS